jgi:hypothetical protein
VSPTALPTASLKVLFGTVGVCVAFVMAYGILGIPPHPFIRLIIIVAPLVAAINWLQADARARRVPLVHDMGFFLWLAWPAVIPWYAFKTRGRHGLPLALVVMLAIISPLLLAVVFEVARSFKGK